MHNYITTPDKSTPPQGQPLIDRPTAPVPAESPVNTEDSSSPFTILRQVSPESFPLRHTPEPTIQDLLNTMRKDLDQRMSQALQSIKNPQRADRIAAFQSIMSSFVDDHRPLHGNYFVEPGTQYDDFVDGLIISDNCVAFIEDYKLFARGDLETFIRGFKEYVKHRVNFADQTLEPAENKTKKWMMDFLNGSSFISASKTLATLEKDEYLVAMQSLISKNKSAWTTIFLMNPVVKLDQIMSLNNAIQANSSGRYSETEKNCMFMIANVYQEMRASEVEEPVLPQFRKMKFS